MILVDELNRATPKAQAALLEALQERQVSLEGQTMKLNEPFIVLSTQVPFGTPGTYPLSEVQADRFAFSVLMGYPTFEDELKVVGNIDSIESGTSKEILSAKEVIRTVETANSIHASEPVMKYILSLVGRLRASQMLRMPPSTRASISLLKGSRALAVLEERDHVIPDDVKFLAPFALQHRIFLTAEALSEDVSPASLVSDALDKVPVPKEN